MSFWNEIQTIAMASGQAGKEANAGGMEMMLFFVALISLMYFVLVRPQKRRDRERQEMLKRIKVGDKVRSVGGILGTVSAVSETTITMQVCDKVTIEFMRESVLLMEEPAAQDAKK